MNKKLKLIVSSVKERVGNNLVSIILFGSSVISFKKANDYDIAQKGKVLHGKDVMSKIKTSVRDIKPLIIGGKKVGWQYA